MIRKNITTLLKDAAGTSFGDEDPLITGLSYDSRDVKPGHIFFALDGIHTDGRKFVESAVKAGAAAVVYGKEPLNKSPGVRYFLAEDTRRAMSHISAEFFGHPSRTLKTIGVTGTDGKSSTVFFIHQLLEACGRKAGLLSTVSFIAEAGLEKNKYRQSTPEAPVIQEVLRRMLDAGKEYAVIEATSHGLSAKTNRLADVEFDAGVITNVTHEHLEFHGTLEQYLSDKTNLFRGLDTLRTGRKNIPCFGLLNADDHSCAYIRSQSSVPLLSYSVQRTDTDLYATDLQPDMEGTAFTLHDREKSGSMRISLPGAFNVENVLAAAGVVSRLLGLNALDISREIQSLQGVRGRMTSISGGTFSVLVDYAHTPGAFARLFPMAKAATQGRILAVFGSGGERDREKRPIQGKIASEYADILILSNEDPRQEEPMELLEDIAAGCADRTRGKDLFLIPDRREAITLAFKLARPGDSVLLLGKGHETSIILKNGPEPWDEIAVAEELLAEAGHSAQRKDS